MASSAQGVGRSSGPPAAGSGAARPGRPGRAEAAGPEVRGGSGSWTAPPTRAAQGAPGQGGAAPPRGRCGSAAGGCPTHAPGLSSRGLVPGVRAAATLGLTAPTLQPELLFRAPRSGPGNVRPQGALPWPRESGRRPL